MKTMLKDDKKFFWAMALLLLLVSGLAYLPYVHKIGYMNDDWYWMYDAYTQGADFLYEVWRIDRPGRALLMIPMVRIFGERPLGYHLTAFVFRFLSGVSCFWALRLVWPKRRSFAVIAALLYTLYPGFLAQINPIDYQSHIFALFLGMLSVALTIKSVLIEEKGKRTLFFMGAILTGWGYLSQMEYFISFEVLRLALVFLLVFRKQGIKWGEKIKEALLRWLPFIAAPGGFLIWRLFFFEVERRSTDIGAQLSQIFTSHLVGLWWFVYLVRDVFNVLIVAWGFPLYTIAFRLRLRDTLIGFGITAVVIFLTWLALRWGKEDEDDTEINASRNWIKDTDVIGLIMIVGGLLPVIMVNRHIVFPDLSRYSLLASIGVAILIAGLIERFSSSTLRFVVSSFLIAIAVMTHHANGLVAAEQTAEMNDFWWQVSWRVPNIESGTTLLADYASTPLSEDYILWGPANLVYRHDVQNQVPIVIDLPAAVLTDEVVLKVITGKGVESPERRGNYLTRGFDDVLFLVQTTPDSCVRVIDGQAPELSPADSHRTMVLAPYSQINNVLVDAEFSTPPKTIFGPEPIKKWCYYYQKASLARQQEDWEQVVELFEKALNEGHYPAESIEWMPLLEAYVQTGEKEKMRSFVSIIRDEPFLAQQACQTLLDAAQTNEMKTYIENKICE